MKAYTFTHAHKIISNGVIEYVAEDARFKYKVYAGSNDMWLMRMFVIDGAYWASPLRGKARQPEINDFILQVEQFIKGAE